MPKDKRVSEYIEWRTISYREIRLWIILGIAALLLVGVYFVSKYGLSSSGKAVETPPSGKMERRSARFYNLYGDVRVKPAGSANWVTAEMKMQIYPGDMVSTNFDSSCRITFFDGSIYDVKPNSMIYIQESHEDSATQRKTVRVELSKGGVDLATAETPLSKTKLQTSDAVADMAPNTIAQANTGGQNTETLVKVFQGRAKVSTRDGRQAVDVGNNEVVGVMGAKISKSVLPPPPQLIEPQNTEILTTTNPEKFTVLLRWRSVLPNLRFKLTVASDAFFNAVVRHEVISGVQHCLVKGLPFGVYYWRVVPVDAEGREGTTRVVSSFKIRPKSLATAADVKFEISSIDVYGNVLYIKGTTDPFYQLLINNKLVVVENDGKFNHYSDPFDAGADSVTLHILLRNEMGTVKDIVKKIPLR